MLRFAGALLSFFGFIHGETLGWAQQPLVALGYALFGAICLIVTARKEAPA